ncbi:MAG: hypothetical protein QM606_09890 [Leucobacter sp.]
MLQGIATGLQRQIDAGVRDRVSQQIQGLAQALQAGGPAAQQAAAGAAALTEFEIPSVEVVVTDVVALADSDPRGAVLGVAALPLTMGGMLGAVLISFAITGTSRRLTALAVYGVVGGLALAGILQGWFGGLQGDYWANAGAIGLSLVAISATIVGFRTLLGNAGIGLGAALMFFFANPISGASMPPQFLAGSWGAIGQWFPPGASATLLRGLSYFPDADAAFPWAVIGGWTLLGVLMILAGAIHRRSKAPAPVAEAGTRVVA